jgi:hypothetical protein
MAESELTGPTGSRDHRQQRDRTAVADLGVHTFDLLLGQVDEQRIHAVDDAVGQVVAADRVLAQRLRRTPDIAALFDDGLTGSCADPHGNADLVPIVGRHLQTLDRRLDRCLWSWCRLLGCARMRLPPRTRLPKSPHRRWPDR